MSEKNDPVYTVFCLLDGMFAGDAAIRYGNFGELGNLDFVMLTQLVTKLKIYQPDTVRNACRSLALQVVTDAEGECVLLEKEKLLAIRQRFALVEA